MKYGIKMRIYPNKEQEKLLFYYCKVAHNSWNYLVAKYKDCEKLPIVNAFGIKNYKPEQLKLDIGEDIPQRIYLGVLKTYANAIQAVFVTNSNRPKFHKLNPNKQSFYVTSKTYQIISSCIKIPLIKHNNVTSKRIPINEDDLNYYKCTEIIEPRYTYYKGQWYISGCTNRGNIQIDKDKEFLGLDWGVKNFYTDNNGVTYNYPKSIVREYQRIKRLQSIMDKKVKGSNNYNKIKLRLDKAYERMNNLKYDFIEQLTTKLCRQYHIIIEDINVSDFFKKKKKFISRQSMIAPKYNFDIILCWKRIKFGSYFIKVDSRYTSKSCSNCGFILEKLTLKDRIFNCPCCHNIIDRDINAAINIKNRGIEYISNDCLLQS